jgi:trk system potassium uptake protein
MGFVMSRALSPSQFLVASFAGLTLFGGLLLWLPVAAEPGQTISFLDALFTATSAVCVTGLIVVDTPNAYSTFGEVTLMVLIFAGGLGYMTLSSVLVAALGRKLSLQERSTLQEALNLDTREGVARFAVGVLRIALAIELAGAVLLALRFWPEFGPGRAAYLGLFHSVSAFNNAGFALWPDNLTRYRGDVVVNLVITTLIICGGLGFFVLRELGERRPFRLWSLHTKLAVVITGVLLFTGTVLILALEWTNPRTLAGLPLGEKLLASWFQSVSPRTAGFNTIDIGAMTLPALFLTMALMFIGASPGSTGGGVKTTTFGITVFALIATVRGANETVAFKRRILNDTVARAFFISLIAFLALNVVAGVLLLSEGRDLLRTLFETTSAFGTVGLSMGSPGSVLSLAGHFSPLGKCLVIGMMLLGRVGPLTVAVALAGRQRASHVRYPEGRVFIG